jgi:hypothetical protein
MFDKNAFKLSSNFDRISFRIRDKFCVKFWSQTIIKKIYWKSMENAIITFHTHALIEFDYWGTEYTWCSIWIWMNFWIWFTKPLALESKIFKWNPLNRCITIEEIERVLKLFSNPIQIQWPAIHFEFLHKKQK